MARKKFPKALRAPTSGEMHILLWFVQNPNKWFYMSDIQKGIPYIQPANVFHSVKRLMGHTLDYNHTHKQYALFLTKLPEKYNQKIEYSQVNFNRLIFDRFVQLIPFYLAHAEMDIKTERSLSDNLYIPLKMDNMTAPNGRPF